MSTQFISPTSVSIEGIFSQASHIWTDRRANTLPHHVEEQMFLLVNRSLWTQATVQSIWTDDQ